MLNNPTVIDWHEIFISYKGLAPEGKIRKKGKKENKTEKTKPFWWLPFAFIDVDKMGFTSSKRRDR